MSFRRAVTEPFESERPQIYTLSELRERFGDEATPLLLRRAIKLELVSPVGPASFEVASPRLLEIAAEMIDRGVPAGGAPGRRRRDEALERIRRRSVHPAFRHLRLAAFRGERATRGGVAERGRLDRADAPGGDTGT